MDTASQLGMMLDSMKGSMLMTVIRFKDITLGQWKMHYWELEKW